MATDQSWTRIEEQAPEDVREFLKDEGLEQDFTPTTELPDDGEETTPDTEQQPEPAAEPAADDWQREIAETARFMREQAQRPAQPQQQAQPQADEWIDPLDRPGMTERLAELSERSYDPAAVRELIQLQSDIATERAERRVQQQFAQFAQQTAYQTQAPQVSQRAYQQARAQFAELADDDWNGAISDIFGNNNALLAQALDPSNPNAEQTRTLLTDAALGRAYRNGKLTPQARPKVPAAVRSDARNPAAPRPANEVTDRNYVDRALSDLWRR